MYCNCNVNINRSPTLENYHRQQDQSEREADLSRTVAFLLTGSDELPSNYFCVFGFDLPELVSSRVDKVGDMRWVQTSLLLEKFLQFLWVLKRLEKLVHFLIVGEGGTEVREGVAVDVHLTQDLIESLFRVPILNSQD